MQRLLVLDRDGRVVLSDLDNSTSTTVTDGSFPGAPATRAAARTVVWSAAGQWAAYAVGSDDPDGAHEVRLHEPATGTTRVIASALTAFYLCPSPCGRFLSHLSPGPLGLELGVSDVASGELRVIERGQPVFWSWSPDASQLAVHAGDRVTVVPLDGGATRVLTDDADAFVAPWWTPDGSVVIVADDRITVHPPDGPPAPLDLGAGAGRFALDPDGRRLALVDLVDDRPSLVVHDLLTGERDVVAAERTAAFFWSPEGRRLAALVLAGSSHLQWLVSDGAGVVRLDPFRPQAGWLREVLPFFEQYAQSHTVWSADEGRLVAPGVDADGSADAVVQGVAGPPSTQRLPGARLAWWAGEAGTPR